MDEPGLDESGQFVFFVMKDNVQSGRDIPSFVLGEEGQMQHFPDGYRQSSFVSGEIRRVFCLRLVPHVAGLRESLELGATTGENLP